MLPSSPSKIDQEARAVRERFELVVIGDDEHAIAEAARALFWFTADHPEYVLCRLHPAIDPAPVQPEAKRIESKFGGRCRGCGALIVPGDDAFWTPGEKGVSCLKCGGTK